MLRRIVLPLLLLASSLAQALEVGITDKTILIGQSVALDHGKNAYGSAAVQGAKLYFDQINANGGVHGRKIVQRVVDDESKPAVAEANARKLVADGVFLLFGSVEGGPSTAVVKVADELKVPLFGPMAGSPNLRRPYQPYVFPVRAEHRDEFRALMNWGKTIGLSTVGFLHADSDVGKVHLENVRLIADELGMRVVLSLPFKGEVSDGQVDQMVNNIAERQPDMFFNQGSAGLYQKLITKARTVGLKTTFMAVNSGSSQIVEKLGPLAQGIVFAQVVPNPRERKHPISREYQDAARKAGGETNFSYGALEGFLTAKALVNVLQATGPALTRAGLIKTLESSRFDLGGIMVRYAPGDHQGSNFVDLSIVGRDGKFVH